MAPDGKHLGTIVTREFASNVAFGPDAKTLYITADMLLLRVKLQRPPLTKLCAIRQSLCCLSSSPSLGCGQARRWPEKGTLVIMGGGGKARTFPQVFAEFVE